MDESFRKLADLNRKLREECIWHREQTLNGYAYKLKEEVDEVLDALENNDADELEDELGDLLWNVLFMIRMAEDEGLFDARSLFRRTYEKMARRNAHVFDNKTRDMGEILDSYFDIKAKDKDTKAAKPPRPIISIPSTEECIRMWDEVNMPENMRKHSVMVARIAVALAKKLRKRGIIVNVDLVRSAALLHDLDKILTLNDLEKHGRITREILEKKGYPFLGRIISKHTFPPHEEVYSSWEERLIYYGDQRVQDNAVVSADERAEKSVKRYPDCKELISHNIKVGKNVEEMIFSILDIQPEDIRQLIEQDKDEIREIT